MQCDTRIEWTSEGEQKPDLSLNSGVCETEQTLRKQSQHMSVCVKWAWYHVKPGGTAGSYFQTLSQQIHWDRVFLRVSNEPCADKTFDSRCELAHNRRADGLDAYGEYRDSHKPRSGAETCRHGSLNQP